MLSSIGLLFLGAVFFVIGHMLKNRDDAVVLTFSVSFFSMAYIIAGLGVMVLAMSSMPPNDTTNWWMPVMFLGVLMVLVGIGLPFRPGRKASRH